ncbi:staphylopine uptake ABC transporter ATP-binding protein CntD [Paenibacillus lemnae]|uniref:ABC transporter ATP-binding protein n=1 Tax=Paenibacillus lemnae TaxID=1330551 RepID=A0A848M8W0_PAELE|nr:ABC transporter ATP-binding protein [Paenibacillus lemnae]NMO97658.1 ABC transporter ATP-binding protein [Paenibacillus lemnae]
MPNFLEVNHLKVWDKSSGEVILHDSSFKVNAESCLAVVGESGSGKSVTCRAIMRLNKPWVSQSGEILLHGENLSFLSDKEMRQKRGKTMYLIMQHGMSAFDPSTVVGVHLYETLKQHFGWNKHEAAGHMSIAMKSVMLKEPMEIMNKYPHQLSGGMLQRIMIALALVLEPDLIIADEPTTALDTISQYEVLEQFLQLRERLGCSMIFVSHDLGMVRKLADEVLVMKNGVIVEQGSTESIFTAAKHEYTRYLVSTKQTLNDHFKSVMGGQGVAKR